MDMDDLVKVRVRSGTHHADDKTHVVGDTLTVSLEVYETFRDKFDLVDTDAADAADADEAADAAAEVGWVDETAVAAPIPDLSHYESLSALLAAVDNGEVTAADALAWEQSQPTPRKTAVKMLKARM